MEDIVNSVVFDWYWELVLREMSGTSVDIAFYMIFLILFIIAIHNLHRGEIAGKKVLLGFSWAMAVLGTTEVILRILIMAETLRLLKELVKLRTDLMPGPVPSPPLVTYIILSLAAYMVSVTNNLVVDSLFLYRCYVIWGRQKRVLIVPGVFMISTFILCVASTQDFNLEPRFLTASFIMAAATNLVLVAFTVWNLGHYTACSQYYLLSRVPFRRALSPPTSRST
ncbi:hypothetical protein K438DRAFT_980589 [Mycena galopus ATCC 62051]|nr:hypothetical protein K438DRAFT_980589 [Mycena galopus ATCC 62051]